jgi:phenylpropionate dioxygenase-like ring-hydroxylating dioxygenase large terminal subunit
MAKKATKKKSKKKTVSRRAFAVTSMTAATAPAMLGCSDPKSEQTAPSAEKWSGSGMSGSGDGMSGGGGSLVWQEGTTIPSKYYLEAKHFDRDERYLAENIWLMVDHHSRISKVGDFFTFEFGRGENIIILRDEKNRVRAFHNVCRHRGSRLCRDSADPRPESDRLSVLQLSASGNTQSFRCPYHGWTYDLQGNLTKAHMMPTDFDLSKNGLLPCHVRVDGGHIFVSLSREKRPPRFNGEHFRKYATKYGFDDLKVGARGSYIIKANWKLLIENFVECYHCGPSHRALTTTHNWDYRLTDEEKAFRVKELQAWVGGPRKNTWWEYEGALNPGFVTGSIDGKPVAPLLPNRKEWSHESGDMSYGWSTAYWQAYDDYAVAARFTPRHEKRIDCEIFWLVHPDAVEGKDFQADNLMALWDTTFREDIWLCENQHVGITSGSYSPGQYFGCEGNVAHFAKIYMANIAKG